MRILSLDALQNKQLLCVCDLHSKVKIIDVIIEDPSYLLIDNMKKLLEQHNIFLDSIDCFALCSGPGSFTGLRNIISIVKTLCLHLGKPCLAVNAFDLLRHHLSLSKDDPIAIPAFKGTYFISMTAEDYDNPDKNFFAIENEQDIVVVDTNAMKITNLLGDYAQFLYIQGNLEASLLDANKLKPYYLREPSVSKPKKKELI